MDSRFEFLDLDALLSKSFSELTEVELAFLKSEGIGENMFHQMQGVHSEASLETEVPTVPGYISTALMEQFAEQNPVATAGSSEEKKSGKKKIAWLYWSGAAAIAAVLVLGVLTIDFSTDKSADLALNDTQETQVKKETRDTEKKVEEGKSEILVDAEDIESIDEANLSKELKNLNEKGFGDKSLEREKDVSVKDRSNLATNAGSGGKGNGLTDDLSDYHDDYMTDASATGATSTVTAYTFNGASDIHDDAAGMNDETLKVSEEITTQPLSAVGNMYTLDAVRTESVPGIASREAKKSDNKDLLSPEQDPMLDILHTAW